jgi:glucose/arabinose dehydrogenase
VGQNRFEEVDIIRRGVNYGWNIMEGAHCFSASDCDSSGLEMPIAEYGREDGCSITGGYRYRGSRVGALHGAYIYGDFCSGKIWALRHDGQAVTEHIEIVDSDLRISSFGEGPRGELYILSFDGTIYRLVTP